MHYHLLILHTNFIWWLVNGLKTSDCPRCLKFMFRKIIQISIGMKSIIIFQLYPKISFGDWEMVWKLHHMKLSPSEKIIHFHINMNMSPYDLSPNAYYSYQSPFWYEILRWWQVWILHTKLPYGDICHHMEAYYEKFSCLSPKKPFRWWRSERFYPRGDIGKILKGHHF